MKGELRNEKVLLRGKEVFIGVDVHKESWHVTHGPVPLRPDVCAECKKVTGHDVLQDIPEWEFCHNLLLRNSIMGYENVGGDLDEVTSKRCTFAGFPIRWTKGDGSIVRIVAIVDKRDQ